MKNTSEFFNKAFADKFIRVNYRQLSAKFRVIDSRISEKGISSLDKLNDTCLGLYNLETEYQCYENFEKIANSKFKNTILKLKECSSTNGKKHTCRHKADKGDKCDKE